jgi:DNA-binding transcriptional regulator PaaX
MKQDELESRLLGLLQDGDGHRISALSVATGKSEYTVRCALGRLDARGLVMTKRVKHAVEYRLASRVEIQLARPQLLNRKPYAPGREMRAAMERCAELRVHPSKHT